jgi:putative hydrolase of the HAD superfamily
MIKAVIFDLDDTLYLEGDYVRSGFTAIAQWLVSKNPRRDGRSLKWVLMDYEWDLWNEFNTDPEHAFEHYAQKWLNKNPNSGMFPEELAGMMTEIFRSSQPEIQPCADVTKTLTRLSQHWKLGLLGDGEPTRGQQKLDHLGIAHFFSKVMFAGSNPAWQKPSSDGYGVMIDSLACRAAESIYVADDPTRDFDGPCELGMRTVRVRRPGSRCEAQEPAPGAEPEVTLTNLIGLPDVVAEMNTGIRSGYQTAYAGRRNESAVHILGLRELNKTGRPS